MSWALVFSGQGGQHPEMLPWLDLAGPALAPLRAQLGVADLRAALQDTLWSTRNAVAQPLLTGLALAAWRTLAPGLPAPAAVAGYSVGELPAFAAAGVLDDAAALQLAGQRSAAMDHCAQAAPGGLMSVSGVPVHGLAPLCQASGCHLAIHLDALTAVLGGPHPALAQAETAVQELGARTSRLAVGLASHTPAMQPAADVLASQLAGLALQAPSCPLFCNVDGQRVWHAAQAASALAAQTARTVRWAAVMDQLHARGLRAVLEIGPGRALAAAWQRRHPEVPARAADDFRSTAAVQAWLRACL